MSRDLLSGPSGLGTSAARLGRPVPVEVPPEPGYALRPWGDGTASPLYVPVVERSDDVLAAAVDQRLVEWAGECGFEEPERFLGGQFGRLVTLAHVDTDDVDQLLISARLNAAWWAADDLYADDSSMGASPVALPPRLALVMAAMDPVAPAAEFTVELEEALAADPVLVALRSATGFLSSRSTPTVVQRVCYSTFAMFVSWNAYGAWRHTGDYPPAWQYLATRQHDSFYTSMTLIDAVGGYELPAPLYYDPRVRQLLTAAGTASVMVNDLVSVEKDAADEKPVCNMVLQIQADRDCSRAEAVERAVELHNQLVHDFEAGHQSLLAVPSVELHRFLKGVKAWMGGGFEWHTTHPRYQ